MLPACRAVWSGNNAGGCRARLEEGTGARWRAGSAGCARAGVAQCRLARPVQQPPGGNERV